MKVLSIHWGFSLGGVAKYSIALERAASQIPIDLKTLCILPRGRVVDHDALSTLNVSCINIYSAMDRTWPGKVRRAIALEKPDCLLSHGFNGHLVSLLGFSGNGKSFRRLVTYHGSYHAITSARKLVEPVYNTFTHWYLRNKADSVLSVAKYCKNFLVKKGVSPGKISVVHNGIPDHSPDSRASMSIRREWGLGPDAVILGTASRLDPVKGLSVLMEAFANIAREHLEARLVLIGEGTDRKNLEHKASESGVRDRVVFAGIRTDVPACLGALDVFVLPSLSEYHSIALLEAMRAGLPIVTTNVGGNMESVRHEREGLLVDANNVDQLTRAIRKILKDPALAQSLGRSARQRYSGNFTEEIMLKRTAEWLLRACRG